MVGSTSERGLFEPLCGSFLYKQIQAVLALEHSAPVHSACGDSEPIGEIPTKTRAQLKMIHTGFAVQLQMADTLLQTARTT